MSILVRGPPINKGVFTGFQPRKDALFILPSPKAPVAQLDRAAVSLTAGCRFESCQALHFAPKQYLAPCGRGEIGKRSSLGSYWGFPTLRIGPLRVRLSSSAPIIFYQSKALVKRIFLLDAMPCGK